MASSESEIVEVPDRHRFDEEKLKQYLSSAIAGFRADGWAVKQFKGGQSNPTFFISAGGKRYVMRKQPPGKLLPSAHAVDREYRIITTLGQKTDVPVPKTFCLCTDLSIVGTKFYVMEFLDGRVLRDVTLEDFSPQDRRAAYVSMVETMAKLHNVDWKAVGLEDFGKPGNYYNRQISRWWRQYQASKTKEIPAMDQTYAWIGKNIPDSQDVSIVHGDFRLENLMFHATEPRVIAILDWELCTLGHPLSDVAYNCMPYRVMTFQGMVGSIEGIPSFEEYVRMYCRLTNRPGIDRYEFYEAFSMFRIAAISQGVYKRFLDGNASSSSAGTFLEYTELLAKKALEATGQPLNIRAKM